MGITVGARAHFDGGTGTEIVDDVQVGTYQYYWSGNYLYTHHNGRYTITTDAHGANKISVDLGSGNKIQGWPNRLRLDVTASDSAHKLNGSDGAAFTDTGTASINVSLLPNTTYYVWVYCNGNSDRFYDYRDGASTISITSSGAYGTAGTPSASNGTFGSGIPVTVTGGTSGAKYTLTVSCAGQTTTLLNNSTSTSATWTPAIATYAPLITNANSAQATFSLKTYYAGVQVGSTQTKTITVTFPNTLGPTLASGWASHAYYNTGTAAASIAAYVQGYSKATVIFDSSKITCKYGASISLYRIVCDGVSDASSPYRTGTLTGTSATIKCYVYDSRGQSSSGTLTVNLNAYSKPKLSAISVYRSDSSGNADEDGLYISVKATATISSINSLNSYTLKAYTKTVSASSYTDKGSMTSGTRKILSTYSADTSYDVKIELKDALNNTATYTTVLPTRTWAMKFRDDGQGVAFGKAPEYNKTLQIPADWQMRVGTNALFLLPSANAYSHTMPCFGYVTGSGKSVRLYFIPVYSLIRAGNLTVSTVTAAGIRHSDGGYIGGSNDATLTTYISESGRSGGAIYVELTNDSGWGVTNNTPLSGIATVTYTVSETAP